jgi:hypothetical protein
MSVVANWRFLLPHLIPKRLAAVVPGAVGSNALACFRFGGGAFAAGPLADGLELVLKPGSSVAGNVVPATAATVADFQLALAATRPDWTVDES